MLNGKRHGRPRHAHTRLPPDLLEEIGRARVASPAVDETAQMPDRGPGVMNRNSDDSANDEQDDRDDTKHVDLAPSRVDGVPVFAQPV